MKKFLQFRNGDAIHFESIIIGDIIFQFYVFPNGSKSESEGSVQFFLKLEYLPSYIDCICIYIELKCDAFAKKLRAFKCWHRTSKAIGCTKNQLNLPQFQDLKSVGFSAKIIIKDINFNDTNNGKTKYCIPMVSFKQNAKYSWHIERSMMTRLKSNKSIHSQIFDNIWWFAAVADNSLSDLYELKVVCCAYPHGIRRLQVQVNFNCNHYGIELCDQQTKMVCCDKYACHMTTATIFMVHLSKLVDVQSVVLDLDIEIIECILENDQSIDQSNLFKYNIM